MTKIKTTSILTFTLVQEQLESNFKLIIEALKDQAKDVEDIKNRQSSADKEIKNISENISLSK